MKNYSSWKLPLIDYPVSSAIFPIICNSKEGYQSFKIPLAYTITELLIPSQPIATISEPEIIMSPIPEVVESQEPAAVVNSTDPEKPKKEIPEQISDTSIPIPVSSNSFWTPAKLVIILLIVIFFLILFLIFGNDEKRIPDKKHFPPIEINGSGHVNKNLQEKLAKKEETLRQKEEALRQKEETLKQAELLRQNEEALRQAELLRQNKEALRQAELLRQNEEAIEQAELIRQNEEALKQADALRQKNKCVDGRLNANQIVNLVTGRTAYGTKIYKNKRNQYDWKEFQRNTGTAYFKKSGKRYIKGKWKVENRVGDDVICWCYGECSDFKGGCKYVESRNNCSVWYYISEDTGKETGFVYQWVDGDKT